MGGVTITPPRVQPYEPQQIDPLGQQAKVAHLNMLGQQQQLQQQQLQQNQMDIDSQKAFHKAYMEAQGDPDKTTQLAAKYGAKPEAIQKWVESSTKAKAATLDLVSKQGAKAKSDADLMQGAHDTVAAADPKDRPQLYQQQLGQLHAQGVDVSQLPPQFPGDEAFKVMGVGVKAHTQQVEEYLKQAETQKNQQQAQEAAIATQQKQRVLAGTSPEGITAEQQQQQASRAQQLRQEAQRAFETARHNRADEARAQTGTEAKGTWSIQEDPATGKPVMFNNKTAEVKDAPAAIAKQGTYQKQMGGAEESVQYAKDYLEGKNFTGPGDEALMEKFFDVAKPSTGFRMTQSQISMLNNARSAYQGLRARGKHLLSPNSPYFDDTQREHIVKTMDDILSSKKKAHGGGATPPAGGASSDDPFAEFGGKARQ